MISILGSPCTSRSCGTRTGQWTMLAAEQTDRCYHSTAALLPDGRVLSAGSGEFILNEGTPQQVANNPQNTHDDAQVFSPPYLFKGPQPHITSAPDSVNYGGTFQIGTAQPEQIATVSLIRLSSVTPALDHWDDQFRRMVHQTYELRGVEVTLTGTIEARNDVFVLAGEGRRPPVELVPLDPGGKIQWDPAAHGPQAAGPGEAAAYDTLTRSAGAAGARPLTVTGPLHQTQAGYQLQVRLVEF